MGAALQQIKDRHYTKALEGYVGEILLVGINYDKGNTAKPHSCEIERGGKRWEKYCKSIFRPGENARKSAKRDTKEIQKRYKRDAESGIVGQFVTPPGRSVRILSVGGCAKGVKEQREKVYRDGLSHIFKGI